MSGNKVTVTAKVASPPRMTLSTASSPQPPRKLSDPVQGLAANPLSGHRAVRWNTIGKLVYADPGQIPAGISTHAADSDALITVATPGQLIVEPSWSWVPDQPIFLSANGVLTQVVPASGVQQVMAFAISPTSAVVHMPPPIELE